MEKLANHKTSTVKCVTATTVEAAVTFEPCSIDPLNQDFEISLDFKIRKMGTNLCVNVYPIGAILGTCSSRSSVWGTLHNTKQLVNGQIRKCLTHKDDNQLVLAKCEWRFQHVNTPLLVNRPMLSAAEELI